MASERTGAGMERRDFLQAMSAGGLVLVATATGCRKISDVLTRAPAPPAVPTGAVEPSVYLRIDDTGIVTVVVHRSEMGQGSRTTLAMAAADELEADWSKVRIEQAQGDEARYGSQDTDGSTSIRMFVMPLRQAGATGRALLEAAAAKTWGVPVEEVTAKNGEVVHAKSGRTAPFGTLVAVAKTLPVPDGKKVKLKDPKEFRFLGKETKSLDIADMTTGKAIYGQDLYREGMKIAVVARPPVLGATIKSLDTSAAEKVPGVERVVQLKLAPPSSGFVPLGGVAVVAKNTWAAIQGRKALRIEWTGGHDTYDSDSYREQLVTSSRTPGKVARDQGNALKELKAAPKKVEGDYYIPHLVHAAMEPPAALAVYEEGRCEVWGCTQGPQAARKTVAEVLGISDKAVTANVTFLGGGFGRKSKPDFIAEAALLSKEMAAPVKVVWTREDDFQNCYFHTVAAEHLEAAIDAGGKVTAMLHRSSLPSIGSTFAPNVIYQDAGELSMGVMDFPYDVPNVRAEYGPAPARTRIGWYRSVINIPRAFAISSFVDELAAAAGRDPKEFLLELLGPDRIEDQAKRGNKVKADNYGGSWDDHPIDIARYRRVVELAATEAGWGRPLPKGEGLGIAVHRSFLSYVATVTHVKVTPDGTVQIPRVDVAVDAGFIANPERVRAQMEGGTIMGIGNTLYGEITFKNGRTVQTNFDGYQVARMESAARDVRVHIVDNPGLPGGVGEPGMPPAGASLTNAIFAATGVRIRRLPVGQQLSRVETPKA